VFYLEIVTPEKLFFSDEVEMVITRGIQGDLAILKGRASITTPIKAGNTKIYKNGEEKIATTLDGYISVVGDKTTIVTEDAQWINEKNATY